jgi:chromosome segregation ATPase
MDVAQTTRITDDSGAPERSEPVEGFIIPDSDATALLAERVARMAARLEAAVFERDLAYCVQARLAESYQQLLDQQGDVPQAEVEQLQQQLSDALGEKERLERELRALRQQLSQTESGRQQLQNSQSQPWAELTAVRQQLALSEAEQSRLLVYADSLKYSLNLVLNSKIWRIAQSLLGLVGRRWKI